MHARRWDKPCATTNSADYQFLASFNLYRTEGSHEALTLAA